MSFNRKKKSNREIVHVVVYVRCSPNNNKKRLLIRLYIARFIYKTIEIIERIFCTEIKITIIHAHTSNQLSEGYCHIIGGNVCNCNFSFLVTIRGIPIINRGRRCGWRGFFFFCFFLHGRKINRLRFLRRG